MAERRMFSLKIINSDDFISMTLSAQALYFHLSMRADDDGFVNNPNMIQRMTGAKKKDFELLTEKGFIIPFESGIIVITHWHLHNLIRKERYKETIYKTEKEHLIQHKNGVYEFILSPKCHPNVTQVSPQVRLGKDRLGKVSIGEARAGEVREGLEGEGNFLFDSDMDVLRKEQDRIAKLKEQLTE